MFIMEVFAHQTRFLGHRTVHNVINCAFLTTDMVKKLIGGKISILHKKAFP